jgi:hypothetical protein
MKQINIKKISLTGIAAIMAVSAMSASALAADVPTIETITDKAYTFASQYPYKDGDTEKSFSLYPNVKYTSGIETRDDGVEYECPAIYHDEHAAYFNDYDLKKGEITITVNGQRSELSDQCVIYNGYTLAPAKLFEEAGIKTEFDENLYVTKFSKDDTVLEVIPYLIGMRKNQAEGYYVPLSACARYVDNTLYVPVRAIADEFQLKTGWDGESYTVTLGY